MDVSARACKIYAKNYLHVYAPVFIAKLFPLKISLCFSLAAISIFSENLSFSVRTPDLYYSYCNGDIKNDIMQSYT